MFLINFFININKIKIAAKVPIKQKEKRFKTGIEGSLKNQ
jgi:hypothetical protein